MTTQKKASGVGDYYYVTGTGAGTAADPFIESVGASLTSGGDASAANQTTQITALGSLTETAPGTDTASSGLNGRLQRIAQRLTSLIALLPASLGQTTKTGSLSVSVASDDDLQAKLGIVTETAPATDTASSGLNGRLQRVAQRLTSLIALLPTALGQATMANSLAVVIASNQTTFPVTATVALPSTIYNGKKTVTTAGTRVTLASSQAITSGVTIKALASNSGLIYVGDSSVASTTGYQLSAGDTVFLEIANLNTVNLDSAVNGEGVTYLAS